MRTSTRHTAIALGALALAACGVLTRRGEEPPSAWDLTGAARAYFQARYPASASEWRVLGPFPSPFDSLARDLLIDEGGEASADPSSRPVTIPPGTVAEWRRVRPQPSDAWNPQPFLTRYAGYVPLRAGPGAMGPETALALADIETEGGLHRLVLHAWGSARMFLDGRIGIDRADFHEFFGQREVFANLPAGAARVLVKIENLGYNAQEDAEKVFGSWGFTLHAARAGAIAAGLRCDVPWVVDALPGDTAVMGLCAVRAAEDAPPAPARIVLSFGAGRSSTVVAAAAPAPGAIAFVPFIVPCGGGRTPARVAVRANDRELFTVPVPRGARADALLLRAVVAPSDLSLQPYLLYLPPEKARAPLILYLHGGATTEEELAAWPSGILDAAAENGCAVCAPRAREGAMRSAQAEGDILRALREAAYAAGIDPAAPVVAAGGGRGAALALQLACRYPHLVGAVIAVLRNPFEGEAAPADDVQALGPMAANLRDKPVLLVAADEDRAAEPVERALKAAGAAAVRTRPGSVQPFAPGEARTLAAAYLRVSSESPRAIAFTTERPQWREAWWASIAGFARLDGPASFQARVANGARIEIRSENVAGLRLLPARLRMPPGEVAIIWNGEEAWKGAFIEPILIGRETHGAAAPCLDELLRGTHVYLAPDDPVLREAAARLLARGAARARMGRNAGTWSCEVLSATAAAAREPVNLILFGGPAENAATAALAPRLAPALSATTFDAGGTSFALDEHVVLLVAADPETPDRMVAIIAGAPLEIFARLCADSPANPFAFPERAGGTMVWRVAEDGKSAYEVYRRL
ncbi:MAG TPA: hypothetical protein DCM87_12435 [Planctomycetes bacterium]|nr:hypothetical protein [Planctomycetota bacterium]